MSISFCIKIKIKKVFILTYKENELRPLAAYLQTDPNSLNNFGRGSLKEHLCQIISKSGKWFWRRRLSKIFLQTKMEIIQPYKENTFYPLTSLFGTWKKFIFTRMVAGHLKNIYVYLLKIQAVSMGKESCQNCSYRNIRITYSAPWPPYLLTDPNSLNNFGRGSPKEPLCQIISKSSKWFWRRSLSKIFIQTKKEIIQTYKENMFYTITPLFGHGRNSFLQGWQQFD